MNWFQKKLVMQNTNIWIWATPLNYRSSTATMYRSSTVQMSEYLIRKSLTEGEIMAEPQKNFLPTETFFGDLYGMNNDVTHTVSSQFS
jgi:hypothetical protein